MFKRAKDVSKEKQISSLFIVRIVSLTIAFIHILELFKVRTQ
jgi:hypothetical protein